jgi:hypothetical protein
MRAVALTIAIHPRGIKLDRDPIQFFVLRGAVDLPAVILHKKGGKGRSGEGRELSFGGRKPCRMKSSEVSMDCAPL